VDRKRVLKINLSITFYKIVALSNYA